jgi:phosphoglycerol transferase MdoB-like AlkP superfamily enzyme
MPSLIATAALGGLLVVLIAVTRRLWLSLALVAYVTAGLLVSSAVKHALLGIPLTVADIRFFMLQPAENSKLFLNYPAIGLSLFGLIAVAGLIVALGLKFERPLRIFTWPRAGRALRFGTLSAFAAVVLFGYFGASESSHAARADNFDAWMAFLAMQDMESDNPIDRLNVFFANRNTMATLPPVRPQKRFVRSTDPARIIPPEQLPDILMVLEESTFDPQLIAKCGYAECKPPLFDAAQGKMRIQQGPMLVHTTGGGTWLSEFSFLSGFDWRTFGRGGAYAPVSVAPRLKTSLVWHLHSLGYRTVGICPTEGNFLNARSAYKSYGFDEFYSAEDFKFTNDWHMVSDSNVFTNALQSIAKNDDGRPVFAFVLTIRNHGPHGEEADKIPAQYRPLRTKLSDGLADYLARLNDSSEAYLNFREAWLASPRPRVIGWFGDHQPEVAWSFIEKPGDVNRERLANNLPADQVKYLTYYQLSANFGGASQASSRAATDIAFLGMRTLEFAGVPLDPGERAASQVADTCNGLLYDCANTQLIEDYVAYRVHDLGDVL